MTLPAIAQVIHDTPTLNMPVIVQELENIYHGIIPMENSLYLVVGPICTGKFDFSKKRNYIRQHKLNTKAEIDVPYMEFSPFLNLLCLILHINTGVELTVDDIMNYNHFSKPETPKLPAMEESEIYHHTYAVEREWTDALQNGDEQKAKLISSSVLGTEGKLSSDSLTHSKYLGVVLITLATRTAMENGVPPIQVYQTSDSLINKIDHCKNEQDVFAIYMEVSTMFSALIKDAQNKVRYSNYVEQCKQYMDHNYREPLTLDILAEYTGLNGTYLSHLFSQLEGITIWEYLNKTRVERAQNLLKYSDQPIIAISDYVGFQSQSYFGKIFKKYTGMTPAKFRTRYKFKEF